MTERIHFHFSLSCIGEGNGNPLQCSCLENPRDGWAWWATVYGVAQSRTQLKRLSSSSSSIPMLQKKKLVWNISNIKGYMFMKGHWHGFYVLKPEFKPWLSDSRVHKLKHSVCLFANIKYVSVNLREDGNRHRMDNADKTII